jgi:hydrogenase maturation protease
MNGSRVRIVGLGSPHGDDRAGWDAVAMLADADLPPGIELRTCATPATDLLPALHGARRVILIDAVAGSAPGALVRCARGELGASRAAAASSHGMSVPSLLELAQALGTLPAELSLLGVQIDPADAEGDGLSAPVAAALPALAQAALTEALR